MWWLLFVTPVLAQDLARYSYLSLEASPDLGIGISPGSALPAYDPNNVLFAQVKSRARNEFKSTDDLKLRWDLDFYRGTITLSRFSDLCLSAPPGQRVGLYQCNGTTTWQLYPFVNDPNSASVLKLSDETSCLTVMRCHAGTKTFCDPNSIAPAVNANGALYDAAPGSYLRFSTCAAFLAPVQVWRQKLDCAAGCSPFQQNDGLCDPLCNVAACNFDNGDCGTPSPTPPTAQPTQPPADSRKPTLQTTQRPTTARPSGRPSPQPSGAPTPKPSAHPSPKPTALPSSAPGVQCPPPGQMDYCAGHVQRTCAHNRIVAQNCTWCFAACLPVTDPRVCSVPQLYASCPVTCPSDLARVRCPASKTAKLCLKGTPWHAANCTWCRVTGQCIGGKNPAACTDPSVYAHCGVATRTPTCDACAATHQRHMCAKNALCKWIGALGVCESRAPTPC